MCVCVCVCVCARHTCSGGSVYVLPSPTDTQMTSRWISYTCRARDISGRSAIRASAVELLTDLVSFYLRSGGSLSTHLGPGIAAAGVEQRLGLFTQLWGSPGPGEREDVLRASLIMAASEEINRQGPAGMLQLPPLTEGGGGTGEMWWRWRWGWGWR